MLSFLSNRKNGADDLSSNIALVWKNGNPPRDCFQLHLCRPPKLRFCRGSNPVPPSVSWNFRHVLLLQTAVLFSHKRAGCCNLSVLFLHVLMNRFVNFDPDIFVNILQLVYHSNFLFFSQCFTMQSFFIYLSFLQTNNAN